MGKDGSFFEQCPTCGHIWQTREEFIRDKGKTLIGYQTGYDEHALGYIMFNHTHCHTSFAMEVMEFNDLHSTGHLSKPEFNSDKCIEFCRYEASKTCPAKCKCLYVEDIIKILKSA